MKNENELTGDAELDGVSAGILLLAPGGKPLK